MIPANIYASIKDRPVDSRCELLTGKVHGADWHGKIVTFLLYGTAAVHIIWFHITIKRSTCGKRVNRQINIAACVSLSATGSSIFPKLLILWNLLLIVIMAGKELYMVVSGCLVIRKTGKVHGADWHGKIVTFLLYGTAAVHIIWFQITPMVSDLLIGLCAIMMVISVALYIIQNTRTIKGETV